MKCSRRILLAILLLLISVVVNGQVYHKTDTLPAAIKQDTRVRKAVVNERIVSPKDFSMMVTPTGEADFVKYVQTLPGMASGSDGSSNYYARGGNMGGNVQPLD